MTNFNIRKIEEKDYHAIIDILEDIQNDGDSYFFLTMNKEELLQYWLKKGFEAFICENTENSQILGSYIMGPVALGRFSHIANASYIVAKNARKLGVGKILAQHSIEFSRKSNYLAIQFLQVVSTNFKAINLWQKMGFEIIGRVPQAFNHKDLGLVDALIFYKKL